jgi:aspartyl/asparaginyl-tRNA synthetase
MNKKFWWVIGAAIVIILLVILFFSLAGTAAKNSSLSASPAAIIGQSITVSGWIFCLPRKKSGNECVVGVEDKNGRYYALLDPSGKQIDPATATTGSQITISGNLVTNSNLPQNYNVQQVIEVSQ